MELSAPKQITFWVAAAIAVIGVVLRLLLVPYGGWLVGIAFVILALGNVVKGL